MKEPIDLSGLEPGISVQDLKKIKELLHHAGEFIAYFEVAESKMLLWQQGLEAQVKEQEEKISCHFSSLNREIAALKSLSTEFRQLHFKQGTKLKQAKAMRKNHWSFLGLSLVLSFFSIFSMGLYLCNEWPWESRLRVLHEREVGRALLQAWPTLSQEERDKILTRNKDG